MEDLDPAAGLGRLACWEILRVKSGVRTKIGKWIGCICILCETGCPCLVGSGGKTGF